LQLGYGTGKFLAFVTGAGTTRISLSPGVMIAASYYSS
jgi:hypothetical protein